MRRSKLILFACLWLASIMLVVHTPLTSASTPNANPVPPSLPWPGSIASTGDSITRAYNTGSFPFTDAPANSWSTGTNTSVNSHYLRILAAYPPINGHSFNYAVTGAKMTDLNSQMANVNSAHVDYVTVLLGANDACTSTEAGMTDVATFRAQFQAALNTLSAGSPDAHVFVLSVPNIYNLWSILHNNSSARTAWNTFNICQSMLVNPTSTDQADIDRRNRVLQRVVDYNTQLAEVCAANSHCLFDDNTTFNTNFTASEVSTRDYFHPSLTGQATLAAASYSAGYIFTDATPIATVTSTATRTPTAQPTSTPTNTPPAMLVGHVTWQGRPQPDPLQQLPITLTLRSGNIEMNYPQQTTDASGFFTVSVGGLPGGTYSWRVKGPTDGANTGNTPGYLAAAATLNLTGATATQAEMGVQRAGDIDGDDVVGLGDFTILKGTFGKTSTQTGYDPRADYDGNDTIGLGDFTLLKSNFGQIGPGPISPQALNSFEF